MQQPVEFREPEVAQLFQWVRNGKSASIIGVSNIGKSNLLQYLLDPGIQARYLGESTGSYLFLRLSFFNLPDFTNRSVYSLILEQLEMLDSQAAHLPPEIIQKVGEYHQALLDSGQDELKIQRFFKLAMRLCLQAPDRRLVLLFDQFDHLYREAGDQLFFNLRGLRDTYKYRVSYLVFTRDTLSDLLLESQPAVSEKPTTRFNNMQQAREAFYELLQANLLYLKPYSQADTTHLLYRLAQRRSLPLDEDLIQPLYHLTGGHAGLLRMCYAQFTKPHAEDPLSPNLSALLNSPPILQECQQIWASLDIDEQTVLAGQAWALPVHELEDARAQLSQKGLLKEDGVIFSPLFEQFVKKQKTSLNRPFYLDKQRKEIYLYGRKTKKISATEYRAFLILYEQQNTFVSYNEIYKACYPQDKSNIEHSSNIIATLIHRLRQKMGVQEVDKLIVVRSSEGYMLNNRLPDEQDQEA